MYYPTKGQLESLAAEEAKVEMLWVTLMDGRHPQPQVRRFWQSPRAVNLGCIPTTSSTRPASVGRRVI